MRKEELYYIRGLVQGSVVPFSGDHQQLRILSLSVRHGSSLQEMLHKNDLLVLRE